MFAGGHFLFELVKIAILASVYTFLAWLLYLLITKRYNTSTRFNYGRVFGWIYGLLFVFSFTYFGNHGLGDSANIPMGHFKTMESGDGYAYFEPTFTSSQISIDSFLVKDDRLYAACPSKFMIYDLRTDSKTYFKNKESYDAFAIKNKLLISNSFRKLWQNYDDYWSGWRFWLLP